MSIVHVVPIDDLIEHETGDDVVCVCGPLAKLVENRDGSVHFCVTHHPLDDRIPPAQDPGEESWSCGPVLSLRTRWVCPSCLHIRTPWHWLMRWAGACFDDQS